MRNIYNQEGALDMADSSIILSSAAEAELLKPIDEYVGKIQAQIDELRRMVQIRCAA